jgi:hypothetical protein
MASRALAEWQGRRASELDELLAAHRAVGGTAPGRRYTTAQLNRAYALAVAAQFQGFCRDLHTEAIDELVAVAQPTPLAAQLGVLMSSRRQLDRGNASPAALEQDFGLLGLPLWSRLEARDRRTTIRRARLEELNRWRNAIAHEDFGQLPAGAVLHLAAVKGFRRSCDALAASLDREVAAHVAGIVGRDPW